MGDLEGAEGRDPIQWVEEGALPVDEVDILFPFMLISHCWQLVHILYIPHNQQVLTQHPDPGPIANVQGWEQRASLFWRFVARFFVTIHFSDALVPLRRSPFPK